MDTKAFLKEKWNIVLFFVFAAAVAVTVIYIAVANKDEKVLFSTEDGMDFSKGWTYEFEDGQSGIADLPCRLPNNDSKYLRLTNTLPEVSDKMYFIYRVKHTAVRISVDGNTLIDRLTVEEEKNRWYTLEGLYYLEVPIIPDYSGKEIVIESFSSEKKYLLKVGDVYLGERGSFVVSHINSKVSALICCIVLFLTSVTLFALWGVSKFITNVNLKEMLCLALFTLSVAIWVYTETEMMQILGYGTKALVILAYEDLILMPVPIGLFFYYASERKIGTVASRVVATIPVIWFIIANSLHLLHLVSLSSSLIVTQFILGFELVAIAYIQFNEMVYMHHSKMYGSRMMKIPLIGVCAIVPLGLVEIGKYVFSKNGHSGDGRLITFGVVIYIFALALDNVLRTAYKQVQLENASSMKTQFLANMSHEIRTPLNAILGFNEAIVREPENAEQVKGYALNIREAGDNLKDIINSILDISKIEMGQLQIDSKEYSSTELLDNLSSMFELLSQKKNLEFKTDIDPELPNILIGDEAHIRQILTNILSNAVKYTDKGSVTLKVEVLEKEDDNPMCKLRFSVKDTGRGIREEDRKKLFEKFSRLDTEHFKHVEGTGLGMSIVQLTLSAMGSEIKLDSTYGEGSVFWFDLDQVAIDKNGIGDFNKCRAESSIKENQSIKFRAPKAEVLIVDDVKMNIDAAKALLSFTNMNMDGAMSGAEAIEKVKNKRYDIIFMDHMMPGMDGIEATEKIRNLSVEFNDAYYAMVPVIALTANAIVGVKTLYQQAGMQDFVSKPIQVTSIISTLKRWLPKELIEEEEGVSLNMSEGFKTSNDEDWDLGIDGIDGIEAKKFNVDVEGLKTNLRSYEEAFEANNEELSNLFIERAIENYVTKVHGLKSTSKLVGAMGVYSLAKEIERKGSEEHLIDEGEYRQLVDLYSDVVGKIRAYLGSVEEDISAIDGAEYDKLLDRILNAGKSFDTIEFMTLDEELKKIEVPEEYKGEFSRIKTAVSLLQYTEAATIISERNNG